MSNRISTPDDEYVGYGSPPKKSQFKIGNREHLKRQRKQKDDLARVAQNFLETQIVYRDGQKLKRARRIDIHLKRIQSAALKADLGAIAELMDLRENSKLAALKKVIVNITKAESLL